MIMKTSYKSILLWGFLAAVCILLLTRGLPAQAAEFGPGEGLPEYSNNHGGIIYQGDTRNGTGDADAAVDTDGVITDQPQEAGSGTETAGTAGTGETPEREAPDVTVQEGDLYIHDGVKYRKGELKGSFRLSGYDNLDCCVGSNAGGTTYSGAMPRAGHTVAADLSVLPLGTMIIVEGEKGRTVHNYDGVYKVEDMGGGVNGSHLDIFCNTHKEAAAVTDPGWQYSKVWIAVPVEE